MKLRTTSDLQSALDSESSWRKKELLDVRLSVRGTQEPGQTGLRRAGFALTYAHWEGFARMAFSHYLAYVRSQKITLDGLNAAFAGLAADKHMKAQVGPESGRLAAGISLLRSTPSMSAILPPSSVVKTESNLGSKALASMLALFGLDETSYETRYNWLDSELVKVRNEIAHGEYTAPSLGDYVATVDAVLDLIDTLSNQVLNAAVTGAFKSQ